MASRCNNWFIQHFYLLVILVSVTMLFTGCHQPLKYMKFKRDGKAVKKYNLNLGENNFALVIEAVYWRTGPGLGFHLILHSSYNADIAAVSFKPENITVAFNDTALVWYNPKLDSTYDMIITSNTYDFTLFFWRGSLSKDDIEYLKNNKFPIKIAFDNFIFINDTAVSIDTLYATSPKLTYYDNW